MFVYVDVYIILNSIICFSFTNETPLPIFLESGGVGKVKLFKFLARQVRVVKCETIVIQKRAQKEIPCFPFPPLVRIVHTVDDQVEETRQSIIRGLSGAEGSREKGKRAE